MVLLSTILPAVSYTDLKWHRIPNQACGFLLGCGLILQLWPKWDLSWQEATAATSFIFVSGFFLYLLGQGAGDGKLLAAIASVIGYKVFPVSLLAYGLAGAAALAMIWNQRISAHTRLPLAPAIMVATWVTLVLGVY